MSQVNTRRKQSVEAIMQSLENSNMCVIPTELLRVVLDDNFSMLTRTNEINENIAKSLDLIANNMNSNSTNLEFGNNNTPIFNENVITKLDELIVAINRTNIIGAGISTPVKKQDVQKELKERYTLTEKMIHSEKLSELYTELLSEANPYAPSKFRTHVSADESESENTDETKLYTAYRFK